MYESLIVKHCSPTLAGMKTGSLFNNYFECEEEIEIEIENLNFLLNPKGVYVQVLRVINNKALIYVYRPNKLMNDLLHKDSKSILYKNGYYILNEEECLKTLSRRLSENDKFPHEIGLFLGYPFQDVKGFIENNGKNYKCVGKWKVYSDESKAKETFETYKRCTNIYCQRLLEGLCIQRLTVAG